MAARVVPIGGERGGCGKLTPPNVAGSGGRGEGSSSSATNRSSSGVVDAATASAASAPTPPDDKEEEAEERRVRAVARVPTEVHPPGVYALLVVIRVCGIGIRDE